MAAGKESPNMKPGTMIAVEVEQAVNNVLMVCFRSGGKIYRGALIDTQIGRCPPGIGGPVPLCERLKDNFDVVSHSESDAAVVVIPNENESQGVDKVEHSALSYRQSYFQDMPLPMPRPILVHKPVNFKEKMSVSNARTRPIRLRPRRPLCSKCRSQCGSSFASSTSHASGRKGNKVTFIAKEDKKDNSSKCSRPKKSLTAAGTATVRATSPVIKISYASPHGKGHVVRIPAKTHSAAYKHRAECTELDHRTCAKSQKSIKKIKRPRTSPKVTNEMLNGCLHGNDATSYHEQHRRIRIIKCEGTYHSASPSPPSEEDTQNDSAQRVLQKQGNLMIDGANCIVKTLPREQRQSTVTDGTDNSRDEESRNHSDANSTKVKNTGASVGEAKVAVVMQRAPPKAQVYKKRVTKGRLQDGREMCIGDVVWGKITGFPWWPGRIVEIVVSKQEDGTLLSQLAQITWFGSTTISHMPVAELYPFLPFFAERYNRKKKGVYRDAVRQATEAATTISAEVRALNTMFETSTLQP